MGRNLKKLNSWECASKGILFCVVISIVNFILIAGNRFISEEILNWQLEQDSINVNCEIEAE